jgi:hypothetical protein
MTQKIVINSCHGGFGLSELASNHYRALAGIPLSEYRWEIARDDPHLVQTVQQLGELANTRYSELKVVEVPDGVSWTIAEYDGWEHVAEAHRTWS